VGLLVQHSHERLAAADQHLVWLPDTWLFVQLTQRIEDALTIQMQRPVPVGDPEDPLAGLDDVPFQAVWSAPLISMAAWACAASRAGSESGGPADCPTYRAELRR